MKYLKHVAAAVLIIIFILIGIMIGKAYLDGEFNSYETFQHYIKQFGIFGPIVLIFVQAFQVVIPIMPGAVGYVSGSLCFGWFLGFVYNYIGISAGSLIAFLIARKYGVKIVKHLFSDEKYEKYSDWATKSKSYTVFLIATIVLPFFPDDFLCYFTGLTKMSFKKFAVIIILGKPWCILAYSLFAVYMKNTLF